MFRRLILRVALLPGIASPNDHCPDIDSLFCPKPISSAIVAVIVLTGSRNPPGKEGIIAAFPVTIRTTIVSPIALPTPSITAAEIPEIAAGIMTLYMVCHLVAPSASEPCFRVLGTELIASSDMVTIVGSAIIPSIMEPVSAV